MSEKLQAEGMYLKRLELSGFKSFARQTTFEFFSPITAIVGPNGSGKSNVVESIRWVLGEQSLKTLRGKRGEDFIFSGSPRAPRLGRASVSLVFDNSKKQFPLEFDEVVITRRVTRDGANQYLMNGSQVRLKDIAEMLSNVGLGSTHHHIISQGEADRFLLASPEERRAMLEDALGLKGYHIKREEAERKLRATEENMKQVSLIQKEIHPHLKYLRKQAEKMKDVETLRTSLAEQYRSYVGKEEYSIRNEEEQIMKRRNPLKAQHDHIQQSIEKIQKTLREHEGKQETKGDTEEFEQRIASLQEQSRTLERDLGRIEGKLEDAGSHADADEKNIPFSSIKDSFDDFLQQIDVMLAIESLEDVRSSLVEMKTDIEETLSMFSEAEEEGIPDQKNLLEERDHIIKTLQEISKELEIILKKRRDTEESGKQYFMALREDERTLRLRERDLDAVREQLKDVEFDLEKVGLRRTDLEHLKEEAARFLKSDTVDIPKDIQSFQNEQDREQEKKKLERLRIKVEESGAVDLAVLREYEEVSERDAFLSNQSEDLIKAVKSLRELIGELTIKLEQEFQGGVGKINMEFQEFFKEMFGGGKAELKIIERKGVPRGALGKTGEASVVNSDEEKEEEQKSGIDISVSIPGKRIHSLSMLSGGERALVSIALLFAMSAVNPPPFLVLDETDAALDEANSRRYSALLKNLSKKTQLLVITHNRETMRASGVLYGVTMGSEGVSKLLSLKFEEAVEVAK